MPTCILIPCKSLRNGKSRLSACLGQAARYDLCKGLLERTLRCSAEVVPPSHVRIVTADAEAVTMAHQHAIGAIADAGFGLNAALEHARACLRAEMPPTGPDLMILPIDLPFVTPQCIADVLARPGDCVIAPDQSGTGTNLLYLRSSAPRAVPFAYGAGSYAAHLALAQSHACTVTTVRDRRLAFDLDESADYESWLSRQSAALNSSAIEERPVG
jgi:2-phospho-L-lactate guanylyltransferase